MSPDNMVLIGSFDSLSNASQHTLTDSHDRPPPALKEFTIFDELPTELRLAVWKFALLDGTPDRTSGAIEVLWDPIRHRCRAAVPIPTLLHVCHESREEALKTYELLELSLHTIRSPAVHRNAPQFANKTFRTYIDDSSETLNLSPSMSQHSYCANLDSVAMRACESCSNCNRDPVVAFLKDLSLNPVASQKLQSIVITPHAHPMHCHHIGRLKGLQTLLLDHVSFEDSWISPAEGNFTKLKPLSEPSAQTALSGSTGHFQFLRDHGSLFRSGGMDAFLKKWERLCLEESAQTGLAMYKPLWEEQLQRMTQTLSDTHGVPVEELEAQGWRSDWSAVKVEVVESTREGESRYTYATAEQLAEIIEALQES